MHHSCSLVSCIWYAWTKLFFFVCCSCCSGRVKSASKRLTWQFTHCMTHISATRLGYLQISRQNFHVKWLFKLPHVLPELRKGKQTALSIPMAEQCLFVFFLTEPRQIWATTNARFRNQNNYQRLLFLADIQECYEVTLQLNKEQAVVKDDSRADVWEVTFFYLLSFFKLLSIQYASAPPCCTAEFILLLCVYDPALAVEDLSTTWTFYFLLTSFPQCRLWSHCLVSNPGQQGSWSLLHPFPLQIPAAPRGLGHNPVVIEAGAEGECLRAT